MDHYAAHAPFFLSYKNKKHLFFVGLFVKLK